MAISGGASVIIRTPAYRDNRPASLTQR